MITLSKLKEMETEAKASGNPRKSANFKVAQHEFESLVKSLFDDDGYSYLETPSDQYVQRLKVEAESGDEKAVARYRITKDAYDHFENRGERFHQFRGDIREMRRLLESGETVTDAHVAAARKVAVMNPTAENLAVAAQLKQRKEDQQAGTYIRPEPQSEPKVTREEVEAAAKKAKETSRTQDIAMYAVLKRKLESQEATEQ